MGIASGRNFLVEHKFSIGGARWWSISFQLERLDGGA